MQTVTVSSQGQILLPKQIRDELGIRSGTKISLTTQGDTITLVPHTEKKFKKTKGILRGEINAAGGVEKSHQKYEQEWQDDSQS